MGFIHMTHAESPVRQLGGRGVLRGVKREHVRRRGGQRGPVALRPRLSPGVPLSRVWDREPTITQGGGLLRRLPGRVAPSPRYYRQLGHPAWEQIPISISQAEWHPSHAHLCQTQPLDSERDMCQMPAGGQK